MRRRIRGLSPSMVVALIALFFALGGAAGAATYAIVPLAKRALSADNAKKLQGKTAAQLVDQATEKVVYGTGTAAIPAQSGGHLTIPCAEGNAIAGGFDVPDQFAGEVFVMHEGFTDQGHSWQVALVNAGNATVTVLGEVVCLT